jgi:hypothetical protein
MDLKLKTLLILIVILLTTSCATTKGYEDILKSWVGHDIDQLADSWGYPVH